MSLKSKLEALIYAAEEPVTLDQLAALLKEDLLALKSAPWPETPGQQDSESHLGAVEIETPGEPGSKKSAKEKSERAGLRALLKPMLEDLIAAYATEDHGIEIRHVAYGYRMSTKPDHHEIGRTYDNTRNHPIRLSLQALATL